MTATMLHLQKFKCFGDLDLPLCPLTVLTGLNAAGKSTTLQSMLLLTQALRKAPTSSLLPLNGTLVQLGTVGEVINRDANGPIVFGLESESESLRWTLTPSREAGAGFLAVRLEAVNAAGKHSSSSSLVPNTSSTPSRLVTSLQDIVYLSCIRDTKVEAYPSPEEANPSFADVGPMGEFAPWWYARLADDEVDSARRHPTEERTTVRGQVDAWLNELFPGASANAETLARTSLTRLEFSVGRSNEWHRPANTGYGLSYAFPLLVALVTMRDGQVIIIDSPEGHLHPRAQSKMGKLLAHFAAAGLQVLVESHSDHVVSGIRLAVKAKMLAPEQVAIHFFQGRNAVGSGQIVSPALDAEGSIEAWPDGFFDQFEKDLADLSGWT